MIAHPGDVVVAILIVVATFLCAMPLRKQIGEGKFSGKELRHWQGALYLLYSAGYGGALVILIQGLLP